MATSVRSSRTVMIGVGIIATLVAILFLASFFDALVPLQRVFTNETVSTGNVASDFFMRIVGAALGVVGLLWIIYVIVGYAKGMGQ